MNFKKRVNGSWADIPHYIHNTSTDTITTLPTVLYADGNIATVGLKGNMSQTGTPTPDNPIQPQECGERTGNLWDGTLLSGFYRDASFALDTSGGTVYKSIKIHLVAGTYTVSFEHNVNIVRQILDSVYSENIGSNISSYTFTTTTDAYFGISFRLSQSSSSLWDNSNIMLNTGSTPLPYEPFGVKIPISSGGTTTPVYLGQVQSERKIKKLVLTGEENIELYTVATGNLFRIELPALRVLAHFQGNGICSHYKPVTRSADRINGTISGGNVAAVQGVADIVDDYESIDAFKAYLAQQYAAGTPVTVWYVLAEPTTGIVNEPLMRIGDYADEISGVSIPVTAGGDTISVDTTLQPSEVTVNYKGWHPATVHERTNGAWT